jgi:hypothetical protein
MVQLHVHLHKRFLHMLDVRRSILQQALAVPEVRPQGSEAIGRLETPPEQPVLMQLLEPEGVVHVCLATRDIFDVPGMDQEDL